jgi:hypothetical protein
VLIGLLRKNPRHRMRPPEVERLLARVVSGDTRVRRGLLTPRQRALGEAGVEDASGAVAYAAPPARDGVGFAATPTLDGPSYAELVGDLGGGGSVVALSGAGPDVGAARSPVSPAPAGGPLDPANGGRGRLGRDRLHTRTEETLRHVHRRRRAWPFVLGALAVVLALAVPAYAYLRDEDRTGSAATAASNPPTPPPQLNPAMGVQACRNTIPANEQPVPVGPGDALPHFTNYTDPAGFTLQAPLGWRLSRGNGLLCLRDPTSLRTISVLDLGAREGVPLTLVTQTSAWQAAAELTDFTQVHVTDMLLLEGGAILEYTYVRDQLTMHGENHMMRLSGHLFVVGILTTDSAWSTDREMLHAVTASFDLAPHAVFPP